MGLHDERQNNHLRTSVSLCRSLIEIKILRGAVVVEADRPRHVRGISYFIRAIGN